MKTILLLEDNKDIRENTTELLEIAGYKVITASNGKKGLELAKSELPDIILSDVRMPLLNGHQVFAELRKDEVTKNIPFIFLTSSVEKKDMQSSFDKGVNGYINKPFEDKDLFDTIENCLATKA